MNTVFLKILNMSITAGWLILAVVLVRLLLKKAPKWIACLLWALVALRLVCPVSFESALSLVPSSETIPANIAVQREPAIHSGITIVNDFVNPVVAESFTPAPADSANPLQLVLPVAALIWIAGIAAMLAYALISFLKLRKIVSASLAVGERVFACDEINAPFILGVFRPIIYVPSSMNGETLDHVIRHEAAHLQRHDHWWKPLGYLLLAVYWFHPLCWLAYILLCRDIEMACDEKVVRDMDREDMAAYSQTLLDCSLPRRRIAACPLAFGEVGVKARIKGVLNYRKPAFWIVVIAVAVCCVVAVCFLTNPKKPDLAADPFGKYYSVSDILYESGLYSFSYTRETAPKYCLTDQRELLITESILASEDTDTGDWLRAGRFEEITLSEDNFDRYFRDIRGSATGLRRKNVRAWRLIVSELPDSVFYYLLLQDGGDVCLTYGYWDAGEAGEPDSDDTRIRWVFALTEGMPTRTKMTATVTDIVGGALLVRPVDGSEERRISDCFSVPIQNMPPSPEPRIGDTVEIEYHGGIDTVYPAQLGEIYSIRVLRVTEPPAVTDLDALRAAYPEFFNLPTDKGLEVYVWQMAPDSFSFGVLPGTNREKTNQELWNLKGASAEEMKAILSSYDIDENKVSVIPWQNPISSYIAEYWIHQKDEDPAVTESRRQVYVDNIRRMLFDGIPARTKVAYAGGEIAPDLFLRCLNPAMMAISSVQHLPVYRFDTPEDLAQFRAAFRDAVPMDRSYDGVPSFNEAAAGYDEAFFAEYSVILAYAVADRGAYRFGIQEIAIADGTLCLNVVRTNCPERDTADGACWFVLAEVPDSEIAGCTLFNARIAAYEDPIGALFDAIMSSPAYSSNPGDYLRAHEEEHQQLLADRTGTLQYIFAEFLHANRNGSGQTGLKGHIMRLILDELAPEAQLKQQADTGQAYFDAWMANAKQTLEQHGDAWLQENQPAMYLLLQMMER